MSVTVQYLPPPVELPPMREGETDGRYMDCTPDLGPVGDKFDSLAVLTITVGRQDCLPMGPTDLQPAGSAWPNTLDPTGLIPTFGWTAPVGSANVVYTLTLTANTTDRGRLFIRDWFMPVLGALG